MTDHHTKETHTMTIRQFIRDNRDEIDAAIANRTTRYTRLSDEERRLWILNDEGLYNWARSHGVKI